MTKPGGILLDLDGTVYVGDQPIDGAVEAVQAIRRSGLPLLFVTNTTRRPVRALVDRLEGMGLSVDPEEIFTAPRAAVRWLLDEELRRVHPLLLEATWEDLAELELVDARADAVLVGDLAQEWSASRLDRAFRLITEGARLVAVQKTRYSQGDTGLELDAGPYVAALEFAADVEAEVVGKPSPGFFRSASGEIDRPVDDLVVVGDDLRGDVGGAQRAGARGVLVRTGKYRAGDLEASEIEPDAVLDSIADLPDWLSL